MQLFVASGVLLNTLEAASAEGARIEAPREWGSWGGGVPSPAE